MEIATGPLTAFVRQLLPVAGVLVGIYAVICIAMFLMQSRLVFLPHLPGRDLDATPAAAGLDFEDLAIATQDGETLHGWFVAAPEADLSVVFFHGNAGNISHRLDTLAILAGLGLNVLMVDYRGYGRSTGTPSEQGTYKDAAAAWRYLTTERNIAPNQIVVMGRSLGGSVAIELASTVEARALIIESSFTSVPDLASEIYPWLPVRWLARIHYPNEARIASVQSPVLIVHSPTDEVVPFHHGERLRAASARQGELIELRGGHNDGFMVSPNYVPALRRFIAALQAEQ